MAHPGGRPPKLTPEQKQEVYQALVDYIDRTADPILVGFEANDPVAKKYNVTEDNLQDWVEFTNLRRRAVKKQEAYLLVGGTSGRTNPTFTMFRLRQPTHGYVERQQLDHTTNGKDLPTPILGGLSKNVPSDNSDPEASET